MYDESTDNRERQIVDRPSFLMSRRFCLVPERASSLARARLVFPPTRVRAVILSIYSTPPVIICKHDLRRPGAMRERAVKPVSRGKI